MSPKEKQELLLDLMQRTKFPPSPAQPEASTFHADPRDLKFIKRFDPDDYGVAMSAFKRPLEVRHRQCKALVLFELNEQDPIMSHYECDSYYCHYKWPLVDVKAMRWAEIQHHFYTVLREDDEDLKERPLKQIEIDNGRVRYGSTRLTTDQEIIESRIKRLLEIRESVK